MRRHTACLGRKVEMPKERPITETEARLRIREFLISVLLRDVAAFNRRRRDIEFDGNDTLGLGKERMGLLNRR